MISLDEIKTIEQVSEEYNIHRQTLHSRFKKLIDSKILIEGIDYRNLGKRMPILLAPSSVEKIIEPSYASSDRKKNSFERMTKKELIELLKRKELE